MVLEFENDRATVEFTLEEGVTAESYKMNVYATDKTNGGEKIYVFTSREYPLIQGINNWYIIIDYNFYNEAAKRALHTSSGGSIRQTEGESNAGNTLPTILDFSFSVLVGDEEIEIDDVLEIHFVRYIPKLMNILGHTNGEKLQRLWFTEGENDDKSTVDPKLDILDWESILSNSRQARVEYEKFNFDMQTRMNDPYSFIEKNGVRNEINKMVAEGLVSLPTATNPISSFGVLDKTIISHNNQLMPAYEKYYAVSEAVGKIDRAQHILFGKLDDHISSLANFNYHVLAMGQLMYDDKAILASEAIKINIQQFGYYAKDQYDFEDEDPEDSQPLGFWRIVDRQNVDIKLFNILNRNEYYRVSNADYNAYRDVHNMGYDYFLYSTMNMVQTNLTINLLK